MAWECIIPEKAIKELGIEDYSLYERFEFRLIKEDEADESAVVEAECFPPKEACTLEHMRERVKAAGERQTLPGAVRNGTRWI